MTESNFSYTRKRRSPEDPSPQHNKFSQHASKKQKRSYPDISHLPPAFWDNLSTIDLTKRAVEELDRRNSQATLRSRPSYQQLHRPTTRRVLAELKKRFPSCTPAASYLCHCGTRGLKNIKQTARHGGPDLSDLRGHPKPSRPPAMSSTPSSSRPKRKSTSTSSTRPSTNTATTVSTGPYNRNFLQNLIDGGIYPDGYEYPDGRVLQQPANREEINRRLAHPRPSLSPSRFSDEDFRKFKRADALASKEKQVTTSVIPIIEGNIEDAKCVSGGIPFTNLDHLTDGTLVPGNPDIYYGARPEQLDRRVRDDLSGYIIPSTQDDLPILPNYFLAVKGPDGSLAVATKQATYDGGFGARGMLELESYKQEQPVFDNNASTITSIYHGGQLKMFTVYPTRPNSPGDRPEYFMHQLKGWSMTSDIETFRQGATWYRNGRDWAKERRDEAIRQANERVINNHTGTLAQASSFASETTLDASPTIEAPNVDSQTSLTEDFNTTTETSSDEPPDYRASVKRSSEQSKKSPQSRRKRRHARESEYEISQQSELQSSEHSGLSQQFEIQVLEPNSQSSRDSL